MKQYPIVWRPLARTDLIALYDWIAEQAGTDTAFDYTSKIEAAVTKLANFPDRGTPHEDLIAGMRTIVYRRRTIVAYRVLAEEVEILRIIHGGRDLGRMFEEERLWRRSAPRLTKNGPGGASTSRRSVLPCRRAVLNSANLTSPATPAPTAPPASARC